MTLNLSAFKAYDIRGRIPDEINADLIYQIGRAYAAFVKPKKVAVGRDIRLTSDEATYRTPAMAVDPRETIHLVWERRTPEEATLEYTTSTNGGKSFAETRALVQGDEESGVPREAAIVVGGEQMLVSWADGEGGHVGLWPLD